MLCRPDLAFLIYESKHGYLSAQSKHEYLNMLMGL